MLGVRYFLRPHFLPFILLETIGLEIRLHKQVKHTQGHMNNAWSEMVSSTPCLALYSSRSPWLLQTIWDNSAPTTDQPCRLITTLFLLVLHVYDYEQPNAPLPTRNAIGVQNQGVSVHEWRGLHFERL